MGRQRANVVVLLVLLAGARASSAAAPQQGRFDAGWRFARGNPAGAELPTFDDARWEPVDLPHDWAVAGPIAADNPTGGPGGFFPAGVGWYRKTFDAPKEWSGKHVTITFDGVYMLATTWLNGHELGTHPNGYTPFAYDLTPSLRLGGPNVLAVRVDNSRQVNSRWYSGSGIYRHVRLDVRDPLHIAPQGVFVRTEEASAGAATLGASFTAENDGSEADAAADAAIEFAARVYEADADGKPAGSAVANFAPVIGRFRTTGGTRERASMVEAKATLSNPRLWTPESPSRYVMITTLSRDGRVLDTRETPFGVRTISVSAEKGFLLNGQRVLLYGGCVHDDNGALGVAAFDRAEVRRAELLKGAGFNAVRTSHNPYSPAFLDACDRLGLLVIDEAFDCWEQGKNPEDYSRYFKQWWKSDLDAMVLRDRNHPSVVMWSIGNEIPDFGSAQGLRVGAMLVDRVRSLDGTRPITSAVNWWGNIGGKENDWKWDDADALMAKLDVVGYNYQINRYDHDHGRLPARVIAGTESYPRDMFLAWSYSADHPYVLGDFVWTAVDYLGESGIGRCYPPGRPVLFHAGPDQYPFHGACCGDIDITGFRRPISHARNVTWDRGEKLYASVTEPTPDGRPWGVSDWAVAPSWPSWTWPGREAEPLEVQVWSRYDGVRLYLNDRKVGEAPTTRARQFAASFRVPYAAGTLRAAGVQDGEEVASVVLRTAGAVAGLRLTPDRTAIAADGEDLSFVTVESVDKDGNFQPNGDQVVTFTVEGPAKIAGVASGDLSGTQPHEGNRCPLFHGRAQVVIRSAHDAGTAEVRAVADGLSGARARVLVRIQAE